MEVILKSEYNKLGKKGDIITVKPGYGRNFLIPQGIAIVANKGNKKVALENAKQAERRTLMLKERAKELLVVLERAKIVIKAKVGERGKIFGSITPLQISKALKVQGIEVDYNNINLEVVIKEIGTYQAELFLHKEISYQLNFNVIPA
ncbi:50S ribosomal protein L9 [Cardinium endosymbiont of Culicoides punctatus]|uniref:50S ribosomal protein L9 n=1 Tax=Cardinium endosymbiont of Culicoides punctatus TaxID=2304601 RepID=UPI001058AF5B|nr:50S ribosomal protein L9 [Cardinium endosymbiont of Culicoides punctatus]TDG94995.1 50S ribosomal protein L9 [Cardinium endosymbiont of Culicoides punctatus]